MRRPHGAKSALQHIIFGTSLFSPALAPLEAHLIDLERILDYASVASAHFLHTALKSMKYVSLREDLSRSAPKRS